MKLDACPRCEGELGDKWGGPGRKLRQYCYYCEWQGELRTPEQKAIRTSKTKHFGGFHYEGFDKYGHIVCLSRSYRTREEAIKEIERELEVGKREDNDAGPYTIVLYPSFIVVKGEVFK